MLSEKMGTESAVTFRGGGGRAGGANLQGDDRHSEGVEQI